MRYGRVGAAFGLVLASSLSLIGCGGGGGHGGGNNIAVVQSEYAPNGTTSILRLHPNNASSFVPVSLQDQTVHAYDFPAVAGNASTLTIDTTPSGAIVQLGISQLLVNGASVPQSALKVQTPYTTTIDPSADANVIVTVFDTFQNNVTLQTLKVTTAKTYSSTSFKVFIHICGDDYQGFDPKYPNLESSQTDQQKFTNDLVNGLNTILASTGVQISGAGFRHLTNAQVTAIDASLVQNGRTVLDPGDLSTNVPAKNWGKLGIDASDAQWGSALDIFVVQTPISVNPGIANPVNIARVGTILKGNGIQHSIVVTPGAKGGGWAYYLSDSTTSDLIQVTCHELLHAIGALSHSTERNFTTVDDISDTPFSTKAANDTNNNGVFDINDSPGADISNLMFPFDHNGWGKQISAEQGRAIQAVLSIREH